MKLNNKGFAITALLYGLLILFVFFVSSYLMVLSAKKDKVDIIIDEIEDEYVSKTYEDDKFLLIDYIKKLYVSGNPELITQETTNDVYYYSYQDTAKTWGLMNDGFKVDTTQAATTTGLAVAVTDTTKLTNGTEGNIRYFGPSDSVNNYVYFNCFDYSNQLDSTCEKWRIIGIVDGKVKIIRSESIAEIAWDQYKNKGYTGTVTYFYNNWEEASLQLMLNSSYYNGDTAGTITYYSGSTGGTTKYLNMSTLGFKNDTTRGLISESIWYLGGNFYSFEQTNEVYTNEMYAHERKNIVGTTIYSGNPFTIATNVGLMYASDYGYATDLSKCSEYLQNFSMSDVCKTSNWLANGEYQWLINPNPAFDDETMAVSSSGNVDNRAITANSYGVYPVLYLNTDLVIESGVGTNENPYMIGLN